ncbi:PREDICTED: DNA-directed RNA polymerase I subunit RPA34 [Elephantulus edwardii]|uniref:DNA-directed RNA polymerase I subunit RPA34 n=1 Tax=Elephantulus edwardii TaxID=28737 RepID=UPI0003F0C94D|nr:PREDICTED: DNA-directed RNA polymerase I subunit RPA34 [Elephantulus edwardii]
MDPRMAGPADPASEGEQQGGEVTSSRAGAARFSCPPNFAAMPPASEPPRLSLETLMAPDTELWLIRTPADFTPNCLDGRLVPLCGSQIVKGKVAGKRHRYRVLSTSGPQMGEATLLAPSVQADGGLTCAPTPQGSLRIFEGLQNSLPGTTLQPIPASLPPQIPPGLKPRFCAFAGSPPVTGPGSALSPKKPASGKKKKKRQVPEASVPWEPVNGNGAQEVNTNLGSPEQPEGVEPLAIEPPGEVPEAVGVPSLSTTKKKKKKKLRGTEVSELYMGLPEPDVKPVKSEPGVQAEPQEETALSPTKRKMQKGAEVTEPVEGTGGTSPLQVKVEPQDEALPLPSVKKRKKEKRHKEMTDSQGCGGGGEPVPETVEMEGRRVQEEGPEPELPGDEAALVWTKKKKKKEKWQQSMLEPGAEAPAEAMDPGLPGNTEPQAAPAATKKRKKERGPLVTEPGSEVTGPPGVHDEAQPEPQETPASTKKRKKERGPLVTEPGSEVTGPPGVHDEAQPEPQETPASTKKRKKERGSLVTEPGSEVTGPPGVHDEAEPEPQETPASTKKRKKERGPLVTEPGSEVTGPPGVHDEAEPEPQETPASTKKRKKERGPLVTEPGSEVTGPPGVHDEAETEPQETPASTKKRRDSESGGLHQDALLLNVDPGEGAVGKRQKKRKKHLQQDPV